MFNTMHWLLCHWDAAKLPIVEEFGWVVTPVWTDMEKRESLATLFLLSLLGICYNYFTVN
jgi:hypothetical protein